MTLVILNCLLLTILTGISYLLFSTIVLHALFDRLIFCTKGVKCILVVIRQSDFLV